MNIIKSTFLFLLLILPGIAQELPVVTPVLKAVIKGPKEVLAGTLVFLSNEDAVGDNKVWIIPDDLKQQSATCTTSIFFALPKPGNYTFGLIVADKAANIDYTFITITATGTIVVPPVDPPVDPPKPPVTGFAGLRKASTTGSSFLGDNETSKRLNIELTRLANAVANKSLPEAKADVVRGLEQVFATRSYESRKKDWITNWRIPINVELDKLQLDTPTYCSALLAIAGALCIDGKCPLIP